MTQDTQTAAPGVSDLIPRGVLTLAIHRLRSVANGNAKPELADVAADDLQAALLASAAGGPVGELQGVTKSLPANKGYEPDGPVGMALSWLKSALSCEAFVWDGDQREYATQSLADAEKWLSDLLAVTPPSAALTPLAVPQAAVDEGVPLVPIATVYRGGVTSFGKATAFRDWLPGSEKLPDGEHTLFAAIASTGEGAQS